jgi:ribosome biogenesis GTPase
LASVPDPDDPQLGRVLRVDAKVCHVAIGTRQVAVPLRGKLFEGGGAARRPVAAGDLVRLSTGPDGSAIEAVLPRRSKLARRASGEAEREQVIAANVTLVLIVAALREPPFQPVIVDRILASCERQELTAALVLTKLDRDRDRTAPRWAGLYGGLGYRVFQTSVAAGRETDAAFTELAAGLRDNTTVLAGLSGVGKSTLLNRLVPGLDRKVGSMNRIAQGKHTTTNAELIPLPGGGFVLDTPGVRSFGLFGMGVQELGFYFREIAPLLTACDYRNCTHLVESSCAVRQAVADGRVDPSRYESYREICTELQEQER